MNGPFDHFRRFLPFHLITRLSQANSSFLQAEAKPYCTLWTTSMLVLHALSNEALRTVETSELEELIVVFICNTETVKVDGLGSVIMQQTWGEN